MGKEVLKVGAGRCWLEGGGAADDDLYLLSSLVGA